MKTLGPRTRISPVGRQLDLVGALAMPIDAGLDALAGVPVAPPPVSVMPQTSSIGTPSAMYQRTRSGEIGAAPVISMRLRWMPISLRTLFSTSSGPASELRLQAAADRLAGLVAAHLLQADADGQLVGPAARRHWIP
jgi:acyl-homoserine lactone acylase PvdQ